MLGLLIPTHSIHIRVDIQMFQQFFARKRAKASTTNMRVLYMFRANSESPERGMTISLFDHLDLVLYTFMTMHAFDKPGLKGSQ